MENPIKMEDLGGTTILANTHINPGLVDMLLVSSPRTSGFYHRIEVSTPMKNVAILYGEMVCWGSLFPNMPGMQFHDESLEQWKKSWLFRVYRGLYHHNNIGIIIHHYFRIPINQPGWLMESSIRGPFFVAHVGLVR